MSTTQTIITIIVCAFFAYVLGAAVTHGVLTRMCSWKIHGDEQLKWDGEDRAVFAGFWFVTLPISLGFLSTRYVVLKIFLSTRYVVLKISSTVANYKSEPTKLPPAKVVKK